jgi:hypothetical protein
MAVHFFISFPDIIGERGTPLLCSHGEQLMPALSRHERNARPGRSFPSIAISFEARVFVAKH